MHIQAQTLRQTLSFIFITDNLFKNNIFIDNIPLFNDDRLYRKYYNIPLVNDDRLYRNYYYNIPLVNDDRLYRNYYYNIPLVNEDTDYIATTIIYLLLMMTQTISQLLL